MRAHLLASTLLTGAALAGVDPQSTQPANEPQSEQSARAHPATAGSSLVVLGQGDNSITIIDGATLVERKRLEVEHTPHEVVCSADGKTGYVMLYGSQTPGAHIAVVDLTTDSIAEVIDLTPLTRPHGVARQGGQLWVTHEANRAVARFDIDTGTVDRVLGHGGAGGHMLVHDSERERIYVANVMSNDLAILSTSPAFAGPNGVTRVEVAAQPEGIALAPDGSEVWLGHRQGGLVSVVDTAAGEVVATIETGVFPFRLAFHPDGSKIYWTEPQRGQLVEAAVESREILRRIDVGAGPTGLVISDDGSWAYVSLIQAGAAAVVDLERGLVAKTIAVGAAPDGIAFAPAPED